MKSIKYHHKIFNIIILLIFILDDLETESSALFLAMINKISEKYKFFKSNEIKINNLYYILFFKKFNSVISMFFKNETLL